MIFFDFILVLISLSFLALVAKKLPALLLYLFGFLIFPLYIGYNYFFIPERKHESITVIKALLSPLIILLAIVFSPFIVAYKNRIEKPALSAVLVVIGGLLYLVVYIDLLYK